MCRRGIEIFGIWNESNLRVIEPLDENSGESAGNEWECGEQGLVESANKIWLVLLYECVPLRRAWWKLWTLGVKSWCWNGSTSEMEFELYISMLLD